VRKVVLDLLADVELETVERRQIGKRLDLEENRENIFVHLLEEAEEEIFLGGDVVIEAPLQDAELVGDILDGGRRIAALIEHLCRGG
jgi:hypothetical protein